jgi:putative transposase
MKKARFTETQIIGILKEADAGTPVKEICRSHGISDATYYNWKSKYGGMSASDLKRLKEMERELSQLKRMYADMAMENRALKDLNSRAAREARSSDLSGGRAPAFGSARLSLCRFISGGILQPSRKPRR